MTAARPPDDAKNGVGDEFGGPLESGDGNAKQRFAAEKPANDDDARYGREDDGAEDAGAPASDDLLDDEQHRGDGSVEGGGQTRGRAHRTHEPKLFAGNLQLAAESRGNAGSDLQRWILGTERLSGTDSEGGAEEFADGGTKGDVAVEDVERSLGLVDAAAPDAGEIAHHQHRNDETNQRRHGKHAPAMSLRQRTEQAR